MADLTSKSVKDYGLYSQAPVSGWGVGANTPGFAVSPLQQAQFEETQRQFNVKQGDWERQFAYSQQNQGGLSNLLNQYNQSYNAAKAQNEAKYNQQLGLVNQVSGQQRADTIAATQRQQSDAMQNLAKLGMANTTVAPSLTAGIQRQGQGALNNLSDQLTREKLGVMQGFNYQGMDPNVTSTALGAMASFAPRSAAPSF